jgi:hypothetical protein
MSLDFLPTQPAEQADLLEFLVSCFGARPDAPIANPELMRWKYCEPRPDWSGPRSYVLKQEERIVAHGCAYPVTYLLWDGEVTSMRILDWASGANAPGCGVLLLRKLAPLVNTLMAVGGSEQTLAIMPKVGFRHQGDLDLFARVVRPWRQFRSQPSKNWKAPLKLMRNTVWSRTRLSHPGNWSASRITRFDAGTFPVSVNRLPRPFTPTKRSPEMLNYLLACPGAVLSAFLLLEGGTRRGYFVLSRVGGQTRIADMFVDTDMPTDWRAAFSVATDAAAQEAETCEVLAAGSTKLAIDAIRENGFRFRRRDPILIHDPKGLLAKALPLNLNLLNGDEFYLHDRACPYLT